MTTWTEKGAPENGFTLLEVLIAVAILSLISLSGLYLASQSSRTVSALDAKVEAEIIAENALNEALADVNPLVRGETQETLTSFNVRWRVIRIVQPTPDPRVLKIDITARSSDAQAHAHLAGYKILARAQ